MSSLRSFVIICLALAVTATPRLCMGEDYVASYGACTKGKRTRTWVLPQNRSCTAGKNSLSIDGGAVGCVCELTDYAPVYDSKCGEDGLQQFSLGDLAGCSDSASLTKSFCPSDNTANCGQTLCQCTADDIATSFTPCDPSSHTRKVVYYWSRRCEPGSLELPPPSAAHSCSETCKTGQYLAPPHEMCTACPGGTTSTVDVVYSPPWKILPKNMYAGTDWTVEDDYLVSNPSLSSAYLRLWLDIKTLPAYMTITYRITGKVFAVTGTAYVYLFGRYIYSDTEQENWATITLDLVDREHCLWEIQDQDKKTYCLKANHVLPYTPEMSLDVDGPFTKKDSLGLPLLHEWSDKFYVARVASYENPCAMTTPSLTGKKHWVALINEGQEVQCNWEAAVLHAQSLGASAVIFHTSSELLFETTKHTDTIKTPVVYMRENLTDAALAAIEDLSFKRNDYKEGISEVLFMYDKIAEADSTSSVHIREIRVHGTRTAPTECVKCPRGTNSTEGSEQGCEKCPPNTYQNTPGSTTCIPCDGEVANNGADCLFISKSCTDNDYDPHVGECLLIKCQNDDTPACTEPKRKVDYYPSNCKIADGAPPSSKMVDCEACPMGKKREDGWKCVSCDTGEFLMESGLCEKCLGNTTAKKELVYPESSKWIPRKDGLLCDGSSTCEWSKECEKGSSATCWLAKYTVKDKYQSPQVLTNGAGLANQIVTHRLVYTTEFYATGSANFTYELQASTAVDIQHVQVRFSVFSVEEGVDVFVKENLATEITEGGVFLTIPNLFGEYQFHWEYLKTGETHTDVLFMLRSFGADWVTSGDATTCVPCPAGMVCNDGVPAQCPAGTFSEGNICVPCPQGTYSAFPGSDKCSSCPKGMESTPEGTRCWVPDCVFKYHDTNLGRLSYDLHKLGDHGKFDVVQSMGNRVEMAYEVRLCPEGTQSFVTRNAKNGKGFENLGREVSVERVDAGGMSTLRMKFTEGDHCLGNDGIVRRRMAVVDLICDVAGEAVGANMHDTMYVKLRLSSDPCTASFYSVSPHSCSLCNSQSWALVNLDCANGIRNQTYIRKPEHDGCIAKTLPALPPPQSCKAIDDEHDSGTSTGAITAVVLLTIVSLTALGSLAFALYRRNVTLKQKYARVATRASASAMHQQMGDLDLDETAESPRSGGHDSGIGKGKKIDQQIGAEQQAGVVL